MNPLNYRPCRQSFDRPKPGLTLIELLVVIAVIGVLVALLLPAVQAAREASRRVQCQNNVRQIALAHLNHENATGRFVSGGWGFRFIGQPELGSGKNQPGGWWFSILPYIEQQQSSEDRIYTDGSGTKMAVWDDLYCMQMPIANCPSRNRGSRYRRIPGWTQTIVNATGPDISGDGTGYVPRSDYAVGRGYHAGASTACPWTISEGMSSAYNWQPNGNVSPQLQGVIFQRSETAIAEIRDGTTNTLLIAEKAVCSNPAVKDVGDNQTNMYSGYSEHTMRWGEYAPVPDARSTMTAPQSVFGSAHTGGFVTALCDGSVRNLSFQIELTNLTRLVIRADGGVATNP